MKILKNILAMALLVPISLNAQDEVFEKVDIMAEYIGGEVAMFEMINSNKEWPKEAVANHVRGKVDLIFIITTSGKVESVEIEKGLGFGCDEEAKRLIMLTDGYWKPARKDGRSVNSVMRLPIKFY